MTLDKYDLNPTEDGWELKKRGSKRATRTFETKREGRDYSTDFLADKEASLMIRKKDGSFQEERTYPRSRDPRHRPG